MTAGQERVFVRGCAPSGQVRFEAPLAHGWSPQRVLRAGGWRPVELRGYAFEGPDRVVLEYSVLPAAVQGTATAGVKVVGKRPGSADAAVSGVPEASVEQHPRVVRQRLAAYAVVHSEHGVLLTELSARTSRAGLWVLPGGGVEPGEDPSAAVVREVWEESGQNIELGPLVDVATSHRVGDFHGVMEDFHAVRMIFAAECREPGPLVVHDVGGSTGSAEWFPASAVTEARAISGGVAPWATDAVHRVMSDSRTRD